ncbi:MULTISPECIES: hypothetical protein [Niveibacterium]|uniref:Uncharacterized protein n=1 Tax=Niveibacterium microcysteis TaxID=2811415 RepID=A0ABX7MAZ7_9RHOO|nr:MULTISPECIES: hypothetical protein [Niveibacterium]QSI77650.1 hypothetical protein JY500_03045 [Niveibacterium microcysteis]
MPQLPSGRRIGLSADSVFERVLAADPETLNEIRSTVHDPRDLLPLIDLVEFIPTVGAKEPGVPSATGLVAADMGSERCNWPAADQDALRDWLNSAAAEEWLEDRFDELEAALEDQED